MKTVASMIHGTEKAKELSIAISEDCKDVTDADRCETSYKLLNCFVENAKKRGVDPKKII